MSTPPCMDPHPPREWGQKRPSTRIKMQNTSNAPTLWCSINRTRCPAQWQETNVVHVTESISGLSYLGYFCHLVQYICFKLTNIFVSYLEMHLLKILKWICSQLQLNLSQIDKYICFKLPNIFVPNWTFICFKLPNIFHQSGDHLIHQLCQHHLLQGCGG